MIHGHGDDLYKSGYPVKANFSTNVWYGADATILYDLIERYSDKILHYPEPDAASFVEMAAAHHNVSPTQVIAGNGATELFYLIAHAFAGTNTLLPVPSFAEYEDSCTLYNHHISFVENIDVTHINDLSGLLFICNPNNPDGKIWSSETIVRLLELNPSMTLVIDESFIHFAPGVKSACEHLNKYSNLIIVRSMTKAYSIPGLRLGYALGNPENIATLRRYKQPWTVNVLAIEIGKYLLQNAKSLLPDATLLLNRQKQFSTEISRIPGFRPLPSQTSFFLTETDFHTSRLKDYLLKEHGLLIRDASNFRGLHKPCFRVNTLDDDKNRMLIHALKAYAE